MGAKYSTAGVTLWRRCLVKLGAEKRAELAKNGRVQLRLPVEWPNPESKPLFEEAFIDPGGTDIWGPGPYLKVPNYIKAHDERSINRIFCPWGYPPDRVRVSRRAMYLQLGAVELERVGDAAWEWILTLKPWEA